MSVFCFIIWDHKVNPTKDSDMKMFLQLLIFQLCFLIDTF